MIYPLSKKGSAYDDVQIKGYGAAGESAPDLAVLGFGSPIAEPLAHAIADIPDRKRQKELRQYSAATLIPGVGPWRDAERDMYVDNKLSKGTNVHRSALAERLGSYTSMLLLGALSGIASAGIVKATGGSNSDAMEHGLYGLAGGTGVGLLADMIGMTIGHGKGARTEKEHKDYLKNSSTLAQYLVPGVAGYNWGRRNIKSALATIPKSQRGGDY